MTSPASTAAGTRWFAQHYQDDWLEKTSPEFPLWFRVMAYTFARHEANGHAAFGAGELADLLGKADPATGEWIPCRTVAREVAEAVRKGLIASGSSIRCLQVRRSAVTGGKGANRANAASLPCSWCDRRKRR